MDEKSLKSSTKVIYRRNFRARSAARAYDRRARNSIARFRRQMQSIVGWNRRERASIRRDRLASSSRAIMHRAELIVRARERRVRRGRFERDYRAQLLEGAGGVAQQIELLRQAKPRLHLSDVWICDMLLARQAQQRTIGLQAGLGVVEALALNRRHAQRKERVMWIARPQSVRQLKGLHRPMLVPEIDEVQLIVRFSPQQHAAVLGLLHFLQASGAIAARQEQQPAEDARDPGGDGGVVVVKTEAEVG